MKILGLDIETGASFDTPKEENFITELGAVLFDTEREMPVQIMSELIYLGKEIDPEAEQYTGIDQGMIAEYGSKEPMEIAKKLCTLMASCDAVIAHNGYEFDHPIIVKFLTDWGQKVPIRTWIDSMLDIEYPSNCKSKNLTYLQCFHGFAYPGHRAVFDVMAMLRVANEYDWQEMITVAQSPMVELAAKFDYPNRKAHPVDANYREAMRNFEDTKKKVKDAGFHWDGDAKLWRKKIREIKFNKSKYDFPVKIIPQAGADAPF